MQLADGLDALERRSSISSSPAALEQPCPRRCPAPRELPGAVATTFMSTSAELSSP